MRVLFFVFKMLIVVLLISFAVRMISTAVFRPKPIDTVPTRYAHDPSAKTSGDTKSQNGKNVSGEGNAASGEVPRKTEDQQNKENSKENGKESSKNNEEAISAKTGSTKDVNDLLSRQDGILKLLPEKYIKMLDSLTLKDKIAGIGLFAKISPSDQEDLFNIIKNGVSEDEYEQVNRILKRNLDEGDFARLREIVARFASAGVS